MVGVTFTHKTREKPMNSVNRRSFAICTVLGASALFGLAMENTAEAAGPYRQSYSSWSYNTNTTYYYSTYYYKPTVTYTTYQRHYCIYYPTRPRYVYYYNPRRKVYWGRYDLESKGYSLLAEKDRKEKLEDIPEKAFPKPAEMPFIPESDDKVRMDPIDPAKLPKTKVPKHYRVSSLEIARFSVLDRCTEGCGGDHSA